MMGEVLEKWELANERRSESPRTIVSGNALGF
jgi:hypothetical protein